MGVNRDKVDLWKEDVAKSVDFFNRWFMKFAPKAFRDTRVQTTTQVIEALRVTENLTNISATVLKSHPKVLSMLRMATCPPIARDRLIGLAKVSSNLVKSMEERGLTPPRMEKKELAKQLKLIGSIIEKMTDPDIFIWKERGDKGTKIEVLRAATIVADRLCGSIANPIIRNAQEKRQLAAIKKWLETNKYRELKSSEVKDFTRMPKGTFSFRFNVPIALTSGRQVNIPVDVLIRRKRAKNNEYPLFFEAKSAGDFTNTNKRRKEEAAKAQQLRSTYGPRISFVLFLCGYFDSGYLGYEAAEGIDWVWEHRIDDLRKFGI
ncbi:MAG: XamI family restriction endonuclease [Planctomycetes bacterium]|nr:XamI family restriction endonuclease [Planctomycetota bacterium]